MQVRQGDLELAGDGVAVGVGQATFATTALDGRRAAAALLGGLGDRDGALDHRRSPRSTSPAAKAPGQRPAEVVDRGGGDLIDRAVTEPRDDMVTEVARDVHSPFGVGLLALLVPETVPRPGYVAQRRRLLPRAADGACDCRAPAAAHAFRVRWHVAGLQHPASELTPPLGFGLGAERGIAPLLRPGRTGQADLPAGATCLTEPVRRRGIRPSCRRSGVRPACEARRSPLRQPRAAPTAGCRVPAAARAQGEPRRARAAVHRAPARPGLPAAGRRPLRRWRRPAGRRGPQSALGNLNCLLRVAPAGPAVGVAAPPLVALNGIGVPFAQVGDLAARVPGDAVLVGAGHDAASPSLP
jgi:hypothetical protein